jgi:SAM-dependent methyltransferase
MIEKILHRLFPRYRPRHEIYDDLLLEHLHEDSVWLDIGCGRNEHIARYGGHAKTAIGIDTVVDPDITGAPFIEADLRKIPLPSGYADLITLRMVVEHLERVPDDFTEIERLLKPNGRLIFMTTNIMSPVVFLPRLIPNWLKKRLILKIFKVVDKDVFPTHHRFNSPRVIRNGVCHLRPVTIQYLELVPTARPMLMLAFGLWYSFVQFSAFKYLRSNILAVFEKTA